MLPQIIQGGMGAAVSDWKLAKKVSQLGALGVVSGTGIDTVLIRRLQQGKDLKEAIEHFPFPDIAEKIYEEYYIEGGTDKPFKRAGMHNIKTPQKLLELTILANFVEVWLAKQGHNNPVGINYLEKIQLPHLPSLYGAMLAGVDYVLMGAGIPRHIPGVLDLLAQNKPVSYNINVEEGKSVPFLFDPKQIGEAKELKRPDFIAIISSVVLGLTLKKKAKVDGFVIEGPTAGGHNANPRGNQIFNEKQEPIYGTKDIVNLEKIANIGLPFWLAGGYGRKNKLQEALDLGATGIQVGTLFAFCEESGLDENIKRKVLSDLSVNIYTDAIASPTGFPFKVISLQGTNSKQETYEQRTRICDLGYLRVAYEKENGEIGFRCPSEPIKNYVKKGGDIKNTQGRKCLCNALMANIGLPQIQKGGLELPLITAGDDLPLVKEVLKDKDSYTAEDVLKYLRE